MILEKPQKIATPVNDVLYIFFLKMYLNILDSREVAKENISKSLTLTSALCFWLSILPFLWFLLRLPPSFQPTCLGVNLPGSYTTPNQTFWETLLTPLDYSLYVLKTLKEVDIYPNSILLNHNTLNQSLESLFVYSNDEDQTKLFRKDFGPRLNSTSNQNKLFDLDEIPYKLESFQPRFESHNYNNQILTGSKSELTKILKSPNEVTLKDLKISVTAQKNKLRILKTKNVSKLPDTTLHQLKTNVEAKNLEVSQKALFGYFKTKLFQAPPVSFNDQNKQFEKQGKQLELKKENKLIIPRSMTWYTYPDLNVTQIQKLATQGEFQTKNQTISYFPKSIVFYSPSDSFIPRQSNALSIANSLNLDVPRFDVLRVDNKSFLKHDFNSNDLSLKKKSEFQESLFNAIVLNNTETTKINYFFSNLSKDGLSQLFRSSTKGTLFDVSQQKRVLKAQQPLINTFSFFALADFRLSPSEIQAIYETKKDGVVRISDLRTGKFQLIPSGTHLASNSLSKLISAQPVVNVFDNLVDFSEPFVNGSENLYRRDIGTYWKTKLKNAQLEEFLTINQPITVESIFSISLLGFAFSTFLILKTAYSDYANEFSSYLLDLISSGKGLPLDPSTIEWLNQELGLEEKKGGIRVFPKRFSKKRFTDIAGIKALLPELSELVWYLRNKGRNFSITALLSKSVLLVGPPGTGKTLLVQALASEAEVPVVAQSTSMLSSIGQDLTPGDAIRMAFQKARSLAPCILFLDELDSLGLKRDSLLLNQFEQNLAQNVAPVVSQNENLNFFDRKELRNITVSESSDAGDTSSEDLTNQLRINITNQFNQKKQQERDQVTALTQLLIEIDGVVLNNGILVIGATNRPNVLDPALTRPGRFSKIISIPLPDKAKRIEILKLYSDQLGWNNEINWDYLAKRTKGFSAADLAAMANQSAIQAILNDSKHTLESFENAITVLTTYPTEIKKSELSVADPYALQREVYYKISQALYNYVGGLKDQTNFIELASREPNPRQFQIKSNLNQDKTHLRTRRELQQLLSSLLAGKAGEILMLVTTGEKDCFYWESDFSKKDFYQATQLVLIMIQDWYLYTTFHTQQKFLSVPLSQNYLEYSKNEEIFELLKETSLYLEQQLINSTNSSLSDSIYQKARWKLDTIQEFSTIDALAAEWSRFHLPDPQETERNPEWIPPEEYYHENQSQRANSSTKAFFFYQLFLVERERYAQTLLLNSFDEVFGFLESNREVVDLLAYFLIKRRVLRDFEIELFFNKNSVQS
jgi:ATP-dependent Zn protease